MMTFVERVTIVCFAASYGLALGLELWYLVRPRPIQRLVALGFGGAGLLAHTLYLIGQQLSLVSPLGFQLFLAWILAVFYLYGSIRHGRVAWGLFVLPVVLGLIGLGVISPAPDGLRGEQFWGMVHGFLLLVGAVGGCVSFVASIMYLVQVHRLRVKQALTPGMKMLSLERIEAMNRRGILWAFPLLTAGMLVGLALQWHRGQILPNWDDPKILSSLGLWVVFAILLYLRYRTHVRGRQVALWTIFAFVLLVLALASPMHPGGVGP